MVMVVMNDDVCGGRSCDGGDDGCDDGGDVKKERRDAGMQLL